MSETRKDEFPAQFQDERGRQWAVRLAVPVVYEFCAKHRLRLGQFLPHTLDMAQLMELAYMGTRWQARSIAAPETLEQFLTALEGPSLLAAQGAAANAVVNFTLKTASPEERAKLVATLREIEANMAGGNPSSNSAPLPESPLP